MKIAEMASVESFGQVAEATPFNLDFTSKAAEILSSKLYKNKIQAIIREISCNAYDAHVETDQADKPFSVHLPCNFSKELRIRDYGRGLSQTAMRTVFATFFRTTKDDSNDLIGGLGLGSKSPFSYVDNFTVYSYQGGVRSTYECFKDKGRPAIAQRAVIHTGEPDGLEIVIPVADKDIQSFANEARRVYRWFAVTPEISGNIIDIPSRPELQGSCWSFASDSHLLGAVMGQVYYPIEGYLVDARIKGVAIHFDIGELDIQAGREELSYDERTIAKIKQKLVIVEKEIDDRISSFFSDCENFLDATLKWENTDDAEMRRIFNIKSPTFNGASVVNGIRYFLSQAGACGVEYFGNRKYEKSSDLTFLLGDSQRQNQTRLLKWREANPGKAGYFVTFYNNRRGIDRSAYIEDVTQALAGLNVIKLSTVKLSNPGKKAKLRRLTPYQSFSAKDAPEAEIIEEDGGFYISTSSHTYKHPDGRDLSQNDVSIFYALMSFYYDEPIYIIPATRQSIVKGSDWTAWINIIEKVDNKRHEIIESGIDLDRQVQLGLSYQSFKENSSFNRSMMEYFIEGGWSHRKVDKAIQTIKEAETAYQEYAIWFPYYAFIGKQIKTINLTKDVDDILKDYPLLKYVERSRDKVEWEEALVYMLAKSKLSRKRNK